MIILDSNSQNDTHTQEKRRQRNTKSNNRLAVNSKKSTWRKAKLEEEYTYRI